METVDGYIDFRPDAEYSYLTHRQLRFPVPTALFAPRKASFLGQEITTIDPRTLLHTFHLLSAAQQVIRHLNRGAGKDDHGRDR